jgi:hypothetical protein
MEPAGRPKRIALAATMALLAANVWIGGPLLALWVGSRVQRSGTGSLTLKPIAALTVFASLAVITVVLVKGLRITSAAYDRATGTAPAARRRDSWVSVERRDYRERPSLTLLERMLVVAVACAALAFEIWFFFYSTSPIDQRSGRSSAPLAQAGETAGIQLRSAAKIARVAGDLFNV